MSVFLRRFIEHKKYIVVAIVTVMFCGFVFGFFQYQLCHQTIKNFLKQFFYFNVENYVNNYQLYVIQGGLYILICTYLSSSYLGSLGLLFLLFLKGMQFSFSLSYTLSVIDFHFITLMMIFIEIILEVLLCVSMNLIYIHISLYVTQITFYIEQNFNIKSMLNYKLNCIIISLIIFSISLAFRLYIIPMF